MFLKSPLDIKTGNGHIKLEVHDLLIKLDESEAKCLFDWLAQSLESSVSFLFKLDHRNAEIEGRNYDRYLDFIIFFHHDEEMLVRTLNLSKNEASVIVKKLHQAMKASFVNTH